MDTAAMQQFVATCPILTQRWVASAISVNFLGINQDLGATPELLASWFHNL
jgi:hypothetical protein